MPTPHPQGMLQTAKSFAAEVGKAVPQCVYKTDGTDSKLLFLPSGGRRYRITNVALNSPIQSEDPQSSSFAMRSVDTAVGLVVGLACGMREENIDM